MPPRKKKNKGASTPAAPTAIHNPFPETTPAALARISLPAHLLITRPKQPRTGKRGRKKKITQPDDLVAFAPPPGPIERERRITVTPLAPDQNGARKRKRSYGTEGATPEPRVLPSQRIEEFPNQGLLVAESKLYCSSCCKFVSLRWSRVSQHVRGPTHISNRAKDQANVVPVNNDGKLEDVGRSLSLETQHFRARVLRALMMDGIPRRRFYTGELKKILEEKAKSNLPLTGVDRLIQQIAEEEFLKTKQELEGVNQLSIMFDGATEVSEAFAIVARFWLNGRLQHRLLSLRWLDHSMTAAQQAALITTVISTDYQVPLRKVISCTRDGASVNTACVDILNRFNTSIVDITCVSHTVCLCNVFECTTLDAFSRLWSKLINGSRYARAAFTRLAGRKPKHKATVRWFAEHEMLSQVVTCWSAVRAVVDLNETFAPAIRQELRKLFFKFEETLYLELALVVDIGLHLVTLCYLNSGDEIISPFVHKDIMIVTEVLRILSSPDPSLVVPTVMNVARILVAKNPSLTVQQLLFSTVRKAAPVVQMFKDQFESKHAESLQVWRFCKLFDYHFVAQTEVPELIAELKAAMLPQLQQFLDPMVTSLPMYKAQAVGVLQDTPLMTFWETQKTLLASWHACFQSVALIQPSSAGVERVFSQLRNVFGDRQESTLSDYKQASIMLRFNKISRDLLA